MLEKVLKEIMPTEAEKKKMLEIVKKTIDNLNKEGYEAIHVGSTARGTFLHNSKDIDIFVFFPKNVTRETLEKQAIALGKRILKNYKPETHYAEHPYVRADVEGIRVEIVPCYKIKKGEEIISAVDRSPLHNEYIKKKIEGKEDDVLLLKQFMKAAGCYGAEQKVEGFSGVLCEILILHYGSFEKTVTSAAGWKEKTIIDIENLRKNYNNFGEPLIVIDPVDAERNMAAAVSRTTLSKFILASRRYIKNATIEFFFPKPKEINFKDKLKRRRILMITFSKPDVIEEILWSQLQRLTHTLKRLLQENDYQVHKTMYWTDEKKRCVLVFEVANFEIGEVKKHRGPEIWDEGNCDKFIEKNPQYWVERSRLYTWKKRKYLHISNLIRDLISKSEVVPSHLRTVIGKAKVIKAKNKKKQKIVLQKYFEDETNDI